MKRIQRKRTPGWKSPKNCRYVGRPTDWGNPFRLTPDGAIQCFSVNRKTLDPWIFWSDYCNYELKHIINLYESWITGGLLYYDYLPPIPNIEELRKYDYLSCFCPLNKPCHVDILIELLK